MNNKKDFKNNNLKWDIDNRICIQFPEEVNVDWCDFTEPEFKVDKRTKKVTIEIKYKELKE